MVAVNEELYAILSLMVEDMPEEEGQAALSRLAVMRSTGGFPLDPYLAEALEGMARSMKQKDLDALVFQLLESRSWERPLPLVGLELAVREHLGRSGFFYQVERFPDTPLYRVALGRTKPKLRLEEGVSQAPWAGLLALSRRFYGWR